MNQLFAFLISIIALSASAQDQLLSISDQNKEIPSTIIYGGFRMGSMAEAMYDSMATETSAPGIAFGFLGKSINNNSKFLYGMGFDSYYYSVKGFALNQSDSARTLFYDLGLSGIARYHSTHHRFINFIAEVQLGIGLIGDATRIIEEEEKNPLIERHQDLYFFFTIGPGASIKLSNSLNLELKFLKKTGGRANFGHENSILNEDNDTLNVRRTNRAVGFWILHAGLSKSF